MRDSRLPGFHQLERSGRLAALRAEGWLSPEGETELGGVLDPGLLDRVSENVVAVHELPLGIVTNVLVNEVSRLVPLAVEEPSVVAACSRAALLARAGNGVTAHGGRRLVGGQVLVTTRLGEARVRTLLPTLQERLAHAMTERHPRTVAAGGRLESLAYRALDQGDRGLGVFDFVCDTADAMGANLVNDLAEYLAEALSEGFPGQVLGAIVTNATVGDPARAEVRIPVSALATEHLRGEDVARRIELLSRWAAEDGRRKATHLKGILNGVAALMTALYQDTRALHAALWGYAMEQQERTVVRWWRDGDELCGEFVGPVVCGTAGGTGAVVPRVRLLFDWLGVRSAGELAAVGAAVGLLQNLAALRAIGSEGIQRGHMRLHQRKLDGYDG